MKNQPIVSVIMPAYNAQRYIAEAIQSILSQTYRHFELIVIDDASTDETLRIIQEYAKKDERIKVIALKKNLNCGGDACANEGLTLASGKYIARMDADDIAMPNRLARQVAYLELHKRTFLVGSQADVIDKNGDYMGDKTEPTTHEAIYASYFTFHPLIHPTCMFRRKIHGKPFRYQISYNANNDYLTFFTLLCDGKRFANLPEKLLKFRIHGNNDTFRNIKGKFLNTQNIRLKMVLHHGYRPTPRAVLISLAQSAVVFLLPERVLILLYFKMKGITKQIDQSVTTPLFVAKRLAK